MGNKININNLEREEDIRNLYSHVINDKDRKSINQKEWKNLIEEIVIHDLKRKHFKVNDNTLKRLIMNYMIMISDLIENEDVSYDKFSNFIKQDRLALHNVCKNNGDKEVVKFLINNGSEVNKFPEGEYSPLFHCLKNENMDLVKYLIQNKAYTNIFNKDSSDCPLSPLFHLCGSVIPHMDIIELLINYGANVNIRNSEGFTPFHFLCGNENAVFEMIQLFIDNQANINLKAENGETPFHSIFKNKKTYITSYSIKALFDSRADPNIQNNELDSPLHYASINGELPIEILVFFVQHKANLNLTNIEDKAPLHIFCQNFRDINHSFVLKSFIDLKSDINLKDEYDKKPFDYLEPKIKRKLRKMKIISRTKK